MDIFAEYVAKASTTNENQRMLKIQSEITNCMADAIEGEPVDAFKLASLAADLVKTQGQRDAYRDSDFILNRVALSGSEVTEKRAAEVVVKRLTKKLLQGPDDAWSGRSNDAKRTYFDGYREAAESIITGYEYKFDL